MYFQIRITKDEDTGLWSWSLWDYVNGDWEILFWSGGSGVRCAFIYDTPDDAFHAGVNMQHMLTKLPRRERS